MEQLRKRLSYLRRETPAVSSSAWEDKEETYTHTPLVMVNNEPLAGQHCLNVAPAPEMVAPAQATNLCCSGGAHARGYRKLLGYSVPGCLSKVGDERSLDLAGGYILGRVHEGCGESIWGH
ncbi:hypothetical protein LIER_34770 [Lithospermum erythrorhizon]|uniref:Uncharacterized protein n=1 Tax=Lithospermum erythrorhizon TaxID=34254 RepID=A0AAV3S3Q0_LITER